jgi:PBSX family phage terminase large subunit
MVPPRLEPGNRRGISFTVSEEKQTPADWYRPGKSVSEFHASRSRTRVLIGGRGSGKTTGVAVEVILKHCWRYAGARVYILRKTAQANQDTTLETFELVLGNSGTAFVDSGQSLFKKIEGGRQFRIPSRKAVEMYNAFMRHKPQATKAEIERWMDTVGNKYCSWLLFSGVPTSSHRATRFRGFEASLIVLIEADQFDREDVDLAMACLRWKGSDPDDCDERGFLKEQGLILDTNPPSPRHWIAKWEDEAKTYNDPNIIRFWHIETEENRGNLPPNYIEDLARQYSKNPPMYKRMLLGQYAEAFDGTPVFWAFSQEHVYKDLPFPKGAYLVVGWDFGASANACVFSAYWEEGGQEYLWDIYEYFKEATDTEEQCRQVQKILNEVFPWHTDRTFCAGVLHYCDPAGAQRRDTGKSLTVLASYGFYPGFRRVGLQESISLYNRLLEARDTKQRLVYRIDSKNCPILYAASIGGYRYPGVGEPGYGGDEPLKGPKGGNYDHIADSARYAKSNVLRLMQVGEDDKGPVGKLGFLSKPNRARRWR